MARVTVTELAATLEELQAQIAEMSKHIEYLEKRHAGANGAIRGGGATGGGSAGSRTLGDYGRRTSGHLSGDRRVSGRARSYTADSPGEHERLGTTGARVDPGVSPVAGIGRVAN
jgi:hypothetical protein